MFENPQFLEELVSKNIINRKILQSLTNKYQNNAFEILQYLVQERTAEKNELGKLWSDTLEVAYIDLNKAIFQPEAVKMIPEDFARQNKIIPIYQFGNGLTVATHTPTNSFILDKVEQIVEHQVSAMFAFPEDIDNAIEVQYTSDESLEELAKKIALNSLGKKTSRSDKSKENIPKNILIETPPAIITNNVVKKAEYKSVVSETTRKYLVDNTRSVLNDTYEGKIPKPETCNKIGEVIIEEVADKIDVIFCIRQLRINDEFTYSHTVNVAMMCSVVSKFMGFSPTVIKELTLAAFLHDIGNMRIPKNVLYKNGEHTHQEIELIKKHTVLGYQITKMMGLHEKINEVVLNHHERNDGKGYPNRLKEDEISLNTQIVSIVDVYDSILSNPTNNNEISHHEAINIMIIEGQKAFNFNLLYQFVNISYNQDANKVKSLFKSLVYGEML